MGGCGSKVLNFLVKIHIQLFVLQTSKNVLTHIIHKWGGHISPFHDALRLHRILTVRDSQWGGGLERTRASVLSSNFVLLFQIIVNQKEPDHPSFYIDIRSKGTFSSKRNPLAKFGI